MNIPAVLATLKDVGGVAGSFLFTSKGHLFAREMHSMFDDAALSEAAERLTRLRDTFAAVGDHLELAVIRYQDHRLYLKVLEGGMLCILADGAVNMAALRMAANLVARRVGPELEQAALMSEHHQLQEAPPPLPPAARTIGSAAGPAVTYARQPLIPAGMRRFRGRPVE